MTDWNAIRAEFPALENWTYLNSATFGQIPRCAVDACAGHWNHRDELACTDFLEWYDDAYRLRGAIARLINAGADDIAFVPTASASLGLVVGGIDWHPGDNVVTLGDEFPNYLYLPALVERYGVELREAAWGQFLDAIDARTRLVAISEVNYASGFRPPLAEVSQFLRKRNVIFFVDGTQSTGALRFDVRESDPDALAVHGYKWMCSPTGAGFLYVAPRLREILPPSEVGWRSHRTWREVDDLHHGKPILKETAEKYESGGLPFPLLYALEASVNLVLEIGPAEIETRVLDLARSTRERLRRLGAEVNETGSHIVSAKFSGADPSHLARELQSRRILVAARHGFLRVSPHFYNNAADLDHLESELRALI